MTDSASSSSLSPRCRSKRRPLTVERVFCCPDLGGAWKSWLIAVLAVLIVATPVAAQQASPTAGAPGLAAGVAWLLQQRADDGGFVGFSGTTDMGTTVDAVLALTAANVAGEHVDLQPSIDFMYAGDHALVYAQSGAGQAAKLVLAIVAVGGDPRNVNGVNPLELATRSLDEESGLYGSGVYDHTLVMLALVAAGRHVPKDAISALVNRQITDGSWAFDGTEEVGVGDTNTTAMAVQALVAAGYGGRRDVRQGIAYLMSVQLADGGFPFQPGADAAADGNSTGLVVQALFAAGMDPRSAEWKNAYGALESFQNPSGAFYYMASQPDDNLFATVQAIPAIAGVALPIIPANVATPVAA